MISRQWLICGLLATVITYEVVDAFPHTVFAKRLIEIQKPVVEAKLRAAEETKALLKAKAADAAGKGLAAAAFVKKKALAVAATPVVVAKALKAKFLAKKLGLAATPLLLKELKKQALARHHHHHAVDVQVAPPPVNFIFPPQYLAPAEGVVLPPPEEFTYIEEGKAPAPGGFVENALESLGNAVPILHPITDRMSRPFAFIRNALSSASPPAFLGPTPPEPLFHHLLPDFPHRFQPKYTHHHVEHVPTGEFPVVAVEHDVIHEDVHPVAPPVVEQEVHVEIPHETYGPPHETYGVPENFSNNQSFDFRPITSYGAPV